MAPRSFWKGYLKLSLVTCRVAMTPATSDREKVRFHTLNRETGNRVESRYVDAETGKPVKEGDEAKGYPVGDDEHVILEEEELEAVALESTRTVDIEMFVPRDSISWIWLDKPHYLTPDDKVAEEAFSVIRDAMEATGKVGRQAGRLRHRHQGPTHGAATRPGREEVHGREAVGVRPGLDRAAQASRQAPERVRWAGA